MTWRVLVVLLIIFLTGCAMAPASQSWSRTGRSQCFGQARQPESGLVFFCAESP
ncbi:MAG TPA: hypothetical protein VHZ49_03910 [Methylomirabilota bacterium]|nr:hypothetical protein [Methylomirabilota bacterium]